MQETVSLGATSAGVSPDVHWGITGRPEVLVWRGVHAFLLRYGLVRGLLSAG
jgi:hypothetical protein